MYARMYVRMYVCMYVCMYACMYVCMHVLYVCMTETCRDSCFAVGVAVFALPFQGLCEFPIL